MIDFQNITIGQKVFYQPQAKQKTFHNAIINRGENGFRDFLYGGAARGGKSFSLRWEAHRNCLQYPRLRGLLIRSSFPELERTHLSQLMFDLPSEVLSYNSQKHVARYFNESTLEFGYGMRQEDFQQYLSAEYDFILIDELTTIPFDFSMLLRSRLTASRAGFIPFFACATNPGSVSHNDVRAYFVKKYGLGTERTPNYNIKEVCFVPATVYDNHIVLDRDPGELTRLQQLSLKDQQKFLYGNWDIFEGQFFDEFNTDVHVIKKENYLTYTQLLGMNVLAGMDYGNDTFVYYMAKDHNGNIIVFDEFWDVRGVRSDKIRKQLLFQDMRGLQNVRIKADTNMWIKDSFDVANTSSAADDYVRAGIRLEIVSKAKLDNRGYRINANDAVKDALHFTYNEDQTIKQHPKLKIYARCHKLLETLPTLITDEKDVEDIKDGQYDHPYDGFKYGLMSLWTPKESKKEEDLKMISRPTARQYTGLHDKSLRM